MRDLNIAHNTQMQTAAIIDAKEFAKDNFNLERDHQLNNDRINTTERYKLQAEFLKINQEFEKQLNKWNEDTTKVIKVFNESLGLSSRALKHSELSDELFVAA
jgi:hypothetical protein